MQFVVNSTFLINIINTDISIINDIKFTTIPEVLAEVSYETGIEVDNELNINVLSSKVKHERIRFMEKKQRLLSSTDKKLLNLSLKNKRSSSLITDDKQLRSIAKENKIRCYTTPQLIAFMIKKELCNKKRGTEYLQKLKDVYIRPSDIDMVLKRIDKWR